jgi:hypothetical protein
MLKNFAACKVQDCLPQQPHLKVSVYCPNIVRLFPAEMVKPLPPKCPDCSSYRIICIG